MFILVSGAGSAVGVCRVVWKTKAGWHEHVEHYSRKARASNNVNEVVVGEVHGSPVQKTSVAPRKGSEVRPEMGDEQGFHGRASGVKAGECAKDDRGVGECGGVTFAAEERIYTGESTW